MKRSDSAERRVGRDRVPPGTRRGNASTDSVALAAIVAGALALGVLLLREQRRVAPLLPFDRTALDSSPTQWAAAAFICMAALAFVVAAVRRLPVLAENSYRDSFNPFARAGEMLDAIVRIEPAFEVLSNPHSELNRMFGAPYQQDTPPTEPTGMAPEPTATPPSDAFFRSLVHHAADTIFITGPDATVRFVSDSVVTNYGYARDAVVGRHLWEFIHVEDRRPIFKAWSDQHATVPGTRFTLRCRVRDAADGWRHVEIAATNMCDDSAVEGIVLSARDITERTEVEAQLTHRAFHDGLTSLANRALFRDRVEHALARSRRDKTSGIVVLFLDLDDFKSVNDTMGHDAGDQLLVTVAAKLLNATRGSDTVARLGGDEFAILLENTRVDEEALVVARRLLTSLSAPMLVGSRELRKPMRVGASIGLSRALDDDTADTLLRHADLAMYKAKKGGKNRYEIFHPDMRQEVAERRRLESDMRSALVEGTEFYLLYQPIVDLASRGIVGVEALVRWDHPERGPLVPAGFLPLAEESGLIAPLGRWILRDACRQASRWNNCRSATLGVTINISARQLRDVTLPREVDEALRDFGVDPACITLDITESVIMSDTDSTLGTLFALKELGVRLAIDDFGTGYSSLSHLRQFPVDVLKIDKTFVDGVTKGGQHSALARTVIALADTLGLQTIAEGVEHAGQHEVLTTLGCHLGQGFLFAKPVRAEQIKDVVDNGSATISPATRALAAL
ncbi:MAG: EAL domain-containing protein [bacterium]